MTRAMVLCAGLGTRLRPLTLETPKPLLPLGDRPILEHACRVLRDAGFGPDVVVNTHHLACEFESRSAEFSLTLKLVHEPEILGTAGGIAAARKHFAPVPIVVVIGDVVLDSIPKDFAAGLAPDGLRLAVARRPVGQGNVGMAADGSVVRLRGERFGTEYCGGEYVGFFALGPAALAELPQRGCYIGDFALPRLRRGGRVETAAYTGSFVLPGDDPASYWRANLSWLSTSFRRKAYVAPDARVGSAAELEASLVGSRASVTGVGALERVVVLPGASVRAPLADAIVLGTGEVVRLTDTGSR